MTPDDLRVWRTERGLTLLELGRQLGIHEMTLYRWEHAERPISPLLPLALEGLAARQSERMKKPRLPVGR